MRKDNYPVSNQELEANKEHEFASNPFVLHWRYFPDNDIGLQWQAFFRWDETRYVVIPTNIPAELKLKKDGFTLVYLNIKSIGKMRASGIIEIPVKLLESEMETLADSLKFRLEPHPQTTEPQWASLIRPQHSTTTIKVVLDNKRVSLQPVDEDFDYHWTPARVLHRSKRGKFILVSCTLDLTQEERAQQVATRKKETEDRTQMIERIIVQGKIDETDRQINHMDKMISPSKPRTDGDCSNYRRTKRR